MQTIIGITGGTGCGKTTALHVLSGMGVHIIDCDAVYHHLLETDEAMLRDLDSAFPGVVEDGKLQRKRLGQKVFADSEALNRLNTVIWPHVCRAVEQEIHRRAPQPCAIDAIGLLESSLGALCTVTIAITAPEDARVARLMAREGISRDYAQLRIRAQKSNDVFAAACGVTIENNFGSAEAFSAHCAAIFQRILQGGTKPMSELRDKLLYQPKHGWDRLTAAEEQALEAYCADYRRFLDNGKTERDCVDYTVALAEARGFVPYEAGMALEPGRKVYVNNRGKGIMLAVIGRKPLSEGANIGAAHTDAPRLDLKPNPLYEDAELAYFKTHHYGGVRKYQWVTVPLELHGVVVRADGSAVRVTIGDKEEDPQFIINDLLPHLGREQGKKPLNEAIASESLNILIGSRPLKDDEGADRVKLAILNILHEKYGITEEDFISAELEAVPAAKARELGFDRSLIGAYGHDDRVCAYAELAALFDLDVPERTAVCIFADKEEIGSEGVSGMQSQAFDWFMENMCKTQGTDLRTCFAHSFCLSADVTAAYDPNFAEVYERRNSAYLNHGVGLCKYTGSGGKGGASDASAEVVGYIRKLFNDNGVVWQMAELGKTDAGGGGTVAKFMAQRNIDTLDAGVPVLSMHAPYETVAKLDCYMTYRGMKAVFEAK